MKYVLVVGSVMSGIGKGTVASSIGVVLKKSGYKVTAIKIDPYLNIDSGTMSPLEHGECYVLEDGGETDLDLGNYERFLHVNLTRNHNITTGKIYQLVLQRERHGDYLGKTVQIVPHITNEIQNWIERTACVPIQESGTTGTYEAEICLIELGGTVGDLESAQYTEALRQFRRRCGRDNFFVVNVCYLPQLRGEVKTKPAQNGLARLREYGLDPNLLVVRSQNKVNRDVQTKLSHVCNMPIDRIIMNEDLGSIYMIPPLFSGLGLEQAIITDLNLPERAVDEHFWQEWNRVASQHMATDRKEVRIAIIGKYTGLSDSYLSLTHAVKDAACALNVEPRICFIEAGETSDFDSSRFDLALIPGGFGTRGTEEMINMIQQLRERDVPTLGICLGFQLMVIEWCRNVMGISNAISEEVSRESKKVSHDGGAHEPVICHLSHDAPQELMGGTMKLGAHPIYLRPDSRVNAAYHNLTSVSERFRHRYGLSDVWLKRIETEFETEFETESDRSGGSGMIFSGLNESGQGQVCEVPDMRWYMGVQYHPEYKTRPLQPHPLFLDWIRAAKNE